MLESEKLSYVKALVSIALTDETVTEEEATVLDQFGVIYGLTPEELTSLKNSVVNKTESLDELLSNLSERSTKLMLLYDLLAICYADGQYSAIERQGLKNICDTMGIERSKFEAMEGVFEEQIMLQAKIDEILERSGHETA